MKEEMQAWAESVFFIPLRVMIADSTSLPHRVERMNILKIVR